MSSSLSQGAKANKTGSICEGILIPLFVKNGYTVIKFCEFEKNRNYKRKPNKYKDVKKLVLKNAPYKSIYNHKGFTEFLIINKEKDRTIRLEVKYQQSSGSVDEKYPYVWLNCVYSFQENEIIILIVGTGAKEGAVRWLKAQAEEKWLLDKNKTVSIMNIDEFIEFFNKNLN